MTPKAKAFAARALHFLAQQHGQEPDPILTAIVAAYQETKGSGRAPVCDAVFGEVREWLYATAHAHLARFIAAEFNALP